MQEFVVEWNRENAICRILPPHQQYGSYGWNLLLEIMLFPRLIFAL